VTAVPHEIDTPEIMVDREVLVRNIERMAAGAAARGLALRPHAKTHKIPEIAALQLRAGAAGLTVATIGEAEVFAEHGVTDLFIAYPLWATARGAERLRRLAAGARIAVGTDSAEAARALGRHLADAGAGGTESEGTGIEVLVEIDSGHHRSGVGPAEAVEVARAATAAGLRVAGVFTFPGHSYAPGMPAEAAGQERRALAEAARLLADAGFEAARVSGGSTPSALLTEAGPTTEVRPGVYVFGDAQQLELERCGLGDIALTVAATVVSRHEGAPGIPRRIVLDAGSKVLGSDRPAWATGFGRLRDHPDARITTLSEHHATVVFPDGAELPPLGTRLRVIPNHVCVAVNLVDEVAVVSGGTVVDRWRVAARGRNQ
jgi:D-serine deaminase-like pyridoxal phosphate-dependent protein